MPRPKYTHCNHGHEFTPKNTGIKKRKGGTIRYCKKCAAADHAARYRRSPERYRQYAREYSKANRERIAARERAARSTDEAKAIRRIKYAANRDHIRAYANAWQNDAYRNKPTYRSKKIEAHRKWYERDHENILERQRVNRKLNINGAGDRARAQKRKYYYGNQQRLIDKSKEYYDTHADRIKIEQRERGRKFVDTLDDRYIKKRMRALGYPNELMTDDAIEVFKLTLQLRRHIGATTHGKRKRIAA